jgi:hypothetical protein
MWLSERSGISRARMLLPDSQIGLTMAVPVEVATGPGGPESALAAPGHAIEGRSLRQTGGQRLGLMRMGRPGRGAQLKQARAADRARSVSRYDLVPRCSSVEAADGDGGGP